LESRAAIVTLPAAVDAETKVYLASLGLDLTAGTSEPVAVPAGPAGAGASAGRSWPKARHFLALLWKMSIFTVRAAAVLAAAALVLLLLWAALLTAWYLLIHVVLPALACLIFLCLVIMAVKR